MSALARATARVFAAGLGIPAAACATLVAAMPAFLTGTTSTPLLARVIAARRASDALSVTLISLLFAAFTLARSARAGASERARMELAAIPRALSFAWMALAAIAFVEGTLSPADSHEGTAALVASAVMALAAVALHPAMRVAMRPALDQAALDAVPGSTGERLAQRTAAAVGVPCGAAALLAVLAVAAHGRELAGRQGDRAESTWRLALAVPAVEGEASSGPGLAARVYAAGGALAQRDEGLGSSRSPLPTRGWATAVALAAGLLGALIGRRVGRDAAASLSLATARIESLSGGTPSPAMTLRDDVIDAREVIESLDAVAERFAAMAVDQRRAVSTRTEVARLRSLVFAGVSHDLRGPLNAVLGFAGILELGADGPLTDGQRESVEAVTRGGQELLRLVDDLLDAARIEAGVLRVEARSERLAQVLHAAVDDATERLRSADVHGAPFAVEGVAELSVLTDPSRTARALGALLTYARLRPGASSDAQVSLRIADAAPESITLRIHGPGLSPDAAALAQVFEPFDLPPPGARARAGIGLAVGVAARVLRLQGGAADASVAPEGGMLFTVRLPRAPSLRPSG